MSKKYHFIAREHGFGLGTCEEIASDSIRYFLHSGVLIFESQMVEIFVTEKEKQLKARAGYDLCVDPDKTKKLIDEAEEVSKLSKQYFDLFDQRKLKDLSNEDLHKEGDLYSSWVSKIAAIYAQTEPHCFTTVEETILKAIQNNIKDDKKIREVFSILMTPVLSQNLLTIRDQEFLKLALKQGNGDIEDQIQSFQENYGFIYVVTEETSGDLKDVSERINEASQRDVVDLRKELSDIAEYGRKVEKEREGLMGDLGLGDKEIAFINSAASLGLMRLNLAQYLRYSLVFSEYFLQEYGRRIYLSADQVEAMLGKELEDYLLNDKKKSLDIINERKKRFVLIYEEGEMEILIGKEAEQFIAQIKPPIDIEKIKEITGSVANVGKVRGFVRVVNGFKGTLQKQIEEMKKGEVLVTGMTQPQLLLAVKKASAIVTDEGGINCHAAIMSRELDIPCIIGTKIATKVLKDGDEVEVDADEGIVRILKKA